MYNYMTFRVELEPEHDLEPLSIAMDCIRMVVDYENVAIDHALHLGDNEKACIIDAYVDKLRDAYHVIDKCYCTFVNQEDDHKKEAKNND